MVFHLFSHIIKHLLDFAYALNARQKMNVRSAQTEGFLEESVVNEFLMADSICAVAADSRSSDTVWFVRLHSNPEEATAYITDDYGHNIAPGQTYIHALYYEKQKTTRNSQVYLPMNKVAYLYRDSIVYPCVISV